MINEQDAHCIRNLALLIANFQRVKNVCKDRADGYGGVLLVS